MPAACREKRCASCFKVCFLAITIAQGFVPTSALRAAVDCWMCGWNANAGFSRLAYTWHILHTKTSVSPVAKDVLWPSESKLVL